MPTGRGARGLRAGRDRARRAHDNPLVRGRGWLRASSGLARRPARRRPVTSSRHDGSLQGSSSSPTTSPASERFLVEAPTYDRPRSKILRELGAEIVAIPQDDDGLDVDALEEELGRGPALLYTIPTFQNPSGRTLTRPSAVAASPSSPPGTTCSSTRTTRTGSCGSRARLRRACSSSQAGSACSTARPSRRRSPRESAWATSSCPSSSRPSSRRWRSRPTSRPSCSPRRRSTSSSNGAPLSRTSSASAACSASVATRCSEPSRRSWAAGLPGAGPKVATSCGSTSA